MNDYIEDTDKSACKCLSEIKSDVNEFFRVSIIECRENSLFTQRKMCFETTQV